MLTGHSTEPRAMPDVVQRVFQQSLRAIDRGDLIHRESSKDKEYHFQNWFAARLDEVGENYEVGGRNSYPDFRMVKTNLGFELKGLAYPGRHASFDSNSQIPTGLHNGRSIYYVFGRYPKEPDGNRYPVLDLVVCHGDFLNADHEYTHENKGVKCFGSYGDILIRDRKMYVVPTPYYIAEGLAHHFTLILPLDVEPEQMVSVGELCRREAQHLVVGYSFDLTTNDLETRTIENPNAGREHRFMAWRDAEAPGEAVRLRGER